MSSAPPPNRLNPNAATWHPLRPPSPAAGILTPHYNNHYLYYPPLISTVQYSQLICYNFTIPSVNATWRADEKPRMPRGVMREKERVRPRRKMITHAGGGSTVMIRNIPNRFNRYTMLEFLDKLCFHHNKPRSQSFRCEYDFLYLPMDFRTGYNLGYAFVNFTSYDAADKIKKTLDGYKWGVFEDSNGLRYQSNKVCRVTRARIQGTEDLINRFRNSLFVCHTADYLPVTLSPPRDGTNTFSVPTTVGSHIGYY